MARPGEELILGVNRHSIFGFFLMFGIGGIFIESFMNNEFRLVPICRNESRRMIRTIKSDKPLERVRKRPKTGIDIVEQTLETLFEMVINQPEIMEIDINTLLAVREGLGVQ